MLQALASRICLGNRMYLTLGVNSTGAQRPKRPHRARLVGAVEGWVPWRTARGPLALFGSLVWKSSSGFTFALIAFRSARIQGSLSAHSGCVLIKQVLPFPLPCVLPVRFRSDRPLPFPSAGCVLPCSLPCVLPLPSSSGGRAWRYFSTKRYGTCVRPSLAWVRYVRR